MNAKSGVYDVVALTNWRSQTTSVDLSFSDNLGLSSGAPYVAFDFWGQKIVGIFKDRMEIEVEPHDTRVLLVHPVLNRPQLVGNSRHITGAFSILELAWDSSKNTLHGSVQPVPGDNYTLWVYVPEGVAVSRTRAATKGGSVVPVQHELTGNSLMVSFLGQREAVDWEVEFAGPITQK